MARAMPLAHMFFRLHTLPPVRTRFSELGSVKSTLRKGSPVKGFSLPGMNRSPIAWLKYFRQCYDRCRSPVPGSSHASATWVYISFIGWQRFAFKSLLISTHQYTRAHWSKLSASIVYKLLQPKGSRSPQPHEPAGAAEPRAE